jgi:hypothetical protein
MKILLAHIGTIACVIAFCSPSTLYAAGGQTILKNLDINATPSAQDEKLLTGGCDIDAFASLRKYGCDRGTIFCSPNHQGRAGLNPSFACRLAKYLAALEQKGCRPQIVSAFRSPQDQQRVCGGSYGSGCAQPGKSCHQYGVAVDLKGATIATGCAAATGQMGTQYGIANGYNVNSPYMRSGGHNQCIEKTSASCSPGDQSICGPALFDASKYTGPVSYTNPGNTGPSQENNPANQFNKALTGQPSQGSGQSGTGGVGGTGASSPQQSFQDPISASSQKAAEQGDDGSGMELDCDTKIEKGEKAKITWICPQNATLSRGLATGGSSLNTRSKIQGSVLVSPVKATRYTVQCLKGMQMLEREGNSAEAIACYQQAVVINDNLSPRFYHLAELLLKEKQPETALEAIESALDLEPKNPKYLDLLIEVAILLNDKKMAMDAYNELRLVNPENQKLDSFKSRIGELE